MTAHHRRRYISRLHEDHGQTLTEYSLLIALVVVAAVAAVPAVESTLVSFFSAVASALGA